MPRPMGGNERKSVAREMIAEMKDTLRVAEAALGGMGIQLEPPAQALDNLGHLAQTTAHMLRTGQRHLP